MAVYYPSEGTIIDPNHKKIIAFKEKHKDFFDEVGDLLIEIWMQWGYDPDLFIIKIDASDKGKWFHLPSKATANISIDNDSKIILKLLITDK